MSSNKEIVRDLKHDVNGICQQLTGILPLVEKMITENDPEAIEVLEEMAKSAAKLSDKIRGHKCKHQM